MEKLDFRSINTILQLLALLLSLLGFYFYRVTRNRNKTLIELHRLANKNEIAKLIERGKSEVFIPDGLTKNQQFEIVKEQVNQKHKQYILRISLVIMLMILFFLTVILLHFFPVQPSVNQSHFDKVKFSEEPPVIIGIYPKDVFGPDQKKGLHLGIENSGLNIKVIDLDFLTIAEMKNGKVQELLDSLKLLIKNQNVISIVGPSITECSSEILQELLNSKSKVPVFITSAASEDFLKWQQLSRDLNLFRTGSGIDKRADLIAIFLREKDITHKSLFLIEDSKSKNTFGRLYYHELTEKSEILTNAVKNKLIDTLYYSNDDFPKLQAELNDKLFDYDFVFVLGAGRTFEHIIDTFYTSNKNARLPRIGGWMNGFSLNKVIGKKEFRVRDKKIFEITDINLGRARNFDATPDDNLKNFSKNFGSIHVGLRDFAISYEAAVCITETYKSICQSLHKSVNTEFITFDNNTLDSFSTKMRQSTFEGIMSKIIFSNQGINQNILMDCAVFDSMRNNWVRTDIQDLLIL